MNSDPETDLTALRWMISLLPHLEKGPVASAWIVRVGPHMYTGQIVSAAYEPLSAFRSVANEVYNRPPRGWNSVEEFLEYGGVGLVSARTGGMVGVWYRYVEAREEEEVNFWVRLEPWGGDVVVEGRGVGSVSAVLRGVDGGGGDPIGTGSPQATSTSLPSNHQPAYGTTAQQTKGHYSNQAFQGSRTSQQTTGDNNLAPASSGTSFGVAGPAASTSNSNDIYLGRNNFVPSNPTSSQGNSVSNPYITPITHMDHDPSAANNSGFGNPHNGTTFGNQGQQTPAIKIFTLGRSQSVSNPASNSTSGGFTSSSTAAAPGKFGFANASIPGSSFGNQANSGAHVEYGSLNPAPAAPSDGAAQANTGYLPLGARRIINPRSPRSAGGGKQFRFA